MSDKANDGGPAFPQPTSTTPDGSVTLIGSPGMSLRDHFAGLAMQAIIAKEGCSSDALMQAMVGEDKERDALMFCGADAQRAYIYADAMLRARRPKTAPKHNRGGG